jgi:hypothetical protein
VPVCLLPAGSPACVCLLLQDLVQSCLRGGAPAPAPEVVRPESMVKTSKGVFLSHSPLVVHAVRCCLVLQYLIQSCAGAWGEEDSEEHVL